ncbi:PP2C family protein-serine/threonine phosphatase, partial [Ralstonia solanacearum]|uniref:PP2C family protein-serine/threonine phosphatase n=1 Tax=Ralstonia solanacearum TaxID=305 RepID=UPI00399D7761
PKKIYTCRGPPTLPLIDIGGPVDLEPGDVALLCSDGLWGSVAEDELVDTCTSFSVTQALPELIARALRNAGDTADNTTAIAMMWELDAVTTTQDSVQTDTLPLNAFTTSILDAPQNESGLMSEEEIERSIAEIRAAIDKTTNLR